MVYIPFSNWTFERCIYVSFGGRDMANGNECVSISLEFLCPGTLIELIFSEHSYDTAKYYTLRWFLRSWIGYSFTSTASTLALLKWGGVFLIITNVQQEQPASISNLITPPWLGLLSNLLALSERGKSLILSVYLPSLVLCSISLKLFKNFVHL